MSCVTNWTMRCVPAITPSGKALASKIILAQLGKNDLGLPSPLVPSRADHRPKPHVSQAPQSSAIRSYLHRLGAAPARR